MKQQTNIVKDRIIYEQKALSYNFDSKEKIWTITTLNLAKKMYLLVILFSVAVGITIMIKDIHHI
jgi:hypothetical protein